MPGVHGLSLDTAIGISNLEQNIQDLLFGLSDGVTVQQCHSHWGITIIAHSNIQWLKANKSNKRYHILADVLIWWL